MADLKALPELYGECGRALSGTRAGTLQERTTGGHLPGLSLNMAAAEVRTDIVAVLSSWSALVTEERGLRPATQTVGGLAGFLLANADWLLAHPAGTDAEGEVATLAEQARRTAYPDPVRRIRLGACVEPGCAGQLVASVRARHPVARTEIRCDGTESHTWTARQWTQLRRSMQQLGAPVAGERAEGWLTVSDISRLWGVPIGTVYRLASEQSWRRRRRAGRTHYAESDVHDCFSRRQAG